MSGMGRYSFLAMIALVALVARPAAAQDIQIEAKPPTAERQMRAVAPPLHYETSRPPDTDFYHYPGTRVEHDPAFIEAMSSTYTYSDGSGTIGVSGWTAPNQPVSSPVSGWRDVSGWFAIGLSVTWGGPPPAKARPR